MNRTIWIAFGFLIVIAALTALKAGVATPSTQQASFSDNVIGEDVPQNALSKADKLDVNFVEDLPDKKAVQTTKIIPIKTAMNEAGRNSQEKSAKIISRHWHEKYAKMTTRSMLRHSAGKHKR